MKLHEYFNSRQDQEQQQSGMTKISAEQMQGIMKRAGEITDERMKAITFAEEVSKVAAAEIDNMDFSDPELQKVANELYSYGAGLADGEMITKQAMAPAIYEEAYATILTKIAETMGPEAAEAVDSSLREAGGEEQVAADEIDAVKEEITENVAEALVEQAGGLEAVQQDPELSADILEQSSDIAEQIVEENLAGE